MNEEVVIVGAGLAGLACALRLRERGIPARMFEASDRVGGRVATDEQDGFLLDRGFQVLLTAYPEASRLLDYQALRLASFHSGAKVRTAGGLQTLADPRRDPAHALSTLAAPVGTFADKARILRLTASVTGPSLDQVLARKENTTRHRLISYGFSQSMVDQFFRPFLGGIFLENQLLTSSRKFEFVFRMFSQGTAALPEAGMGAIPKQLAQRFGYENISLRREVVSVEPRAVQLADGERVEGRAVVLATDDWTTRRLLGSPIPEARAVTCLYFAAPRTPIKGPWLVLNGEGTGPVNNVCVPSEVHASYAPAGQNLVSVTVLDDFRDIELSVRTQLTGWFGEQVGSWRHLRSYQIGRPIPLQYPPALEQLEKPLQISDGVYRCSDADWIASIEGALRSGTRVAEAL